MKYSFDPEVCTVVEEKGNKTHTGQVFVDVHKTIETVFIQWTMKISGKTYIDQNFDYCKWLKNPRINVLMTIFDYLKNYTDPNFMQCPVKTGSYLVMKARPKTNKLKDIVELPSFLPYKGLMNLTVIARTRVKKRLKPFYQRNQVIEIS